jgi:hypothetical protein
MPDRIYTVNQKYLKNKKGDIGYYKKKIKKRIKSNKPYKSQKRGLVKPSIYSKRFGFLDLYNRKEQQNLICPSGYSISQCYNVMRKLWYGYHKARLDEKNYEGMVKYAKAIQNVQKDMGINTTSFPHLGLYGDVLIPNDKKGNRIIREDHSELKKKQEKYEIWQVENARKIQEYLQKPVMDKDEVIETIIDDVYPYVTEYNEQTVPELLEPNEEEGEEALNIPDNIPFKTELRSPHRRKRPSMLIIADDVCPQKRIEAKCTVPHLLKPEKDEDLIVI